MLVLHEKVSRVVFIVIWLIIGVFFVFAMIGTHLYHDCQVTNTRCAFGLSLGEWANLDHITTPVMMLVTMALLFLQKDITRVTVKIYTWFRACIKPKNE